MMNVITYQYWELSLTVLVEGLFRLTFEKKKGHSNRFHLQVKMVYEFSELQFISEDQYV